MYDLKSYFCPLAIYRNNFFRNLIVAMTYKRQDQCTGFSYPRSRHFDNYCPYSYFRIDSSIVATSREIKINKKYISEDLKIPVFHGIKNSKIQTQINNSINNDIMEFKRQLEDAAEEYGAEAEKAGAEFKPYVISNNYSITYNKNNILSLSVIYSEYIGGKHSYIRATYNYDLQTGKSMSLEDLFKPDSPYKNLINNEIRRQLLVNKSLYSPDAATKFKGISEDQPFYLENGNIVLFFGFNEIAPTVSQIPIIKIPFTTFKNQINPIFLK